MQMVMQGRASLHYTSNLKHSSNEAANWGVCMLLLTSHSDMHIRRRACLVTLHWQHVNTHETQMDHTCGPYTCCAMR